VGYSNGTVSPLLIYEETLVPLLSFLSTELYRYFYTPPVPPSHAPKINPCIVCPFFYAILVYLVN